MSQRSARGGGAASKFRAAMTEEIELPDDETVTEPADEIEVVEDFEPEPDPAPDYSHEEDEPEPDPAPAPAPDALDDLQRQLAELRGENAELKHQAAGGVIAAMEADHATVNAGLMGANQRLAAATAALEAAGAAQDWKAFAKAQQDVTIATADVREMTGLRDELKAQIDHARKNPPKPQSQPQQPADGFEAAIAPMSAKSQEWCRRNKADLTSDPKRGARATLGHQMAVLDGLTPDTPEYFAFLDKHMGYEGQPVTTKTTKPAGGKAPPAARKPAGRAQVAAPSGAAVPAARGAVTEVRLSAAEIQTAKALGMSTKAYAANKKRIIENGRDANATGPRYSAQSGHSSR